MLGLSRIAITVAIGLLVLCESAWGTGIPALLSNPPEAKSLTEWLESAIGRASSEPGISQGALQERRVNVNVQLLDPRLNPAPARVSIELFDGEVVTLLLQEAKIENNGGATWRGYVVEHPMSTVTFSVIDDAVSGEIHVYERDYHQGKAHYQIRYRREAGGVVLQQLKARQTSR